MKRTMAAAGILFLLIVTASCSRTGEGEATQAGGKPLIAVEVTPAVTGELVQTIDVVGSLAPKFATDIKSEFTAVVSEVYVTEWVHVAKGQPLAKLDTREGALALESAKASLMQAEVNETRASRELERTAKLKEFGLATQQNLDDARTAKDAAAAATSAARAAVRSMETRLEKAIIRAPMDGVVDFRGVSVGDRVENMGGNSPMFRIVDNRLLDLTVTVPSTKSAALRVGLPLEFVTDGVPGRTFRGTVRFINPTVSESDRSVKIVAEVPNEDGALRGGVFVNGRIRTGERAGVLQIPRAALLSWDVEGNSGEIFVINGDVAERRAVRTGEVTGEAVEITQGIAAGDRVVTRGGFNLRAGDHVQIAKPKGA
jgi:RND family efflux transporter MFP subunit